MTDTSAHRDAHRQWHQNATKFIHQVVAMGERKKKANYDRFALSCIEENV